MQLTNPVAGGLGNGLLLAEQSFMPPLFPGAARFHERIMRSWPDSYQAAFPRLRMNKLNEIPGEEGAGLGLGITLPLLLVLGVSLGQFRQLASLKSGFRRLFPPVALAAWVAALVFLAMFHLRSGPIVRARSSRKTSPLTSNTAAKYFGVKSWRSFFIMFTKT